MYTRGCAYENDYIYTVGTYEEDVLALLGLYEQMTAKTGIDLEVIMCIQKWLYIKVMVCIFAVSPGCWLLVCTRVEVLSRGMARWHGANTPAGTRGGTPL